MSNYYAPCFYRIDSVVIPSYTELPCLKLYFQQDVFSQNPLNANGALSELVLRMNGDRLI